MWRDCWAGAAGPRRYRPPSSVIHPDPASFANSIIINQHIGPHMTQCAFPSAYQLNWNCCYCVFHYWHIQSSQGDIEFRNSILFEGFWISCDYLEEESQLREEKYDLVVLQWQTSFSSVFSENVPTLSFLQPSSWASVRMAHRQQISQVFPQQLAYHEVYWGERTVFGGDTKFLGVYY